MAPGELACLKNARVDLLLSTRANAQAGQRHHRGGVRDGVALAAALTQRLHAAALAKQRARFGLAAADGAAAAAGGGPDPALALHVWLP